MAKTTQAKRETDSGAVPTERQVGSDAVENSAVAAEQMPRGKLAFAVWLIAFAALAGYSLFDLVRAQFR